MTRVDTIKAIRAFLESNKLSTEAVNNENGLTHYFFTVNIENIVNQIEVMFSVGEEGDFTSIVFIDLEEKVPNLVEVNSLINWLNLENSSFRGTVAYVADDNAIVIMKSVDSYFHKDIYGEEISYLVKMQTELIKDYYDLIIDVVNGSNVADAIANFELNKEKH